MCREKSCRTSETFTEATSDETVTESGSVMGIDQRSAQLCHYWLFMIKVFEIKFLCYSISEFQSSIKRHRLKGLESKEDSNGQTPEAGCTHSTLTIISRRLRLSLHHFGSSTVCCDTFISTTGPSTNMQTHTTPRDLPLNDALIPEKETDCERTFSFTIKC